MKCSCGKEAEPGGADCFHCRVSTVGITYRGGALVGRAGWNKTRTEHLVEHFGTADDRVMGKKGVERAK